MKKITIVGLSVLLAACASDTYITDVTSESHREEYKVAPVQQPVVAQEGMATGISESNVETNVVKMSPNDTEKKVVKMSPQSKAAVALIPPTAKQTAMNPRFGYTIQVVAVGSQNKVDQFASKLPNSDGQPIWENYKVVNGTKWYTVLYGDYATRADAVEAIKTLPAEFQAMKPFAKSIDTIKNSEFPTLNKLN
ncbi:MULTISPECIES: SPOR domain-containing protein [unclassified Vibrio]|uniref:SPOR domain-containing protein n=1 Tax=unclassified Vibrio TaxID=2614977 RepID=UPI000B8EDE9E|nr:MULTISPECIES: SPOR domain-containing protein [unclassified Vibrio]NAW98267.1 SPOR domain-containing protein [Vibrio sp. V23_P3S9T160]OXX47006.1 cytochrome C biogenesis protein CcdA [Vibrio sp. V11_P1A41T118]